MSKMTPEGKVKAKIKKVLDKYNVYYFSPVTGGFGRSGVPDLVCCISGRFFGIECKANGNKPTELQRKNLHDIDTNGGVALVIDDRNVDDWLVNLEYDLVRLSSADARAFSDERH